MSPITIHASLVPRRSTVSGLSFMIEDVTRSLVALALVAACGSKPDHPPAQIVDLTTSIAELTRDFDAHSGEARFVTILAPS